MRKPFIAGNWKMNKTPAEAREMVSELKELVAEVADVDMAVCPPAVALAGVSELLQDSKVSLGAQNMHWESSGAFTGEISAAMLKELGVEYVILGHSERREIFKETDQEVNRKVQKALQEGLKPIICVGETLAERENGKTKDKVSFQVKAALAGVAEDKLTDVTIAYEPLWAIGTGESASAEDAADTIAAIREVIAEIAPGKEEEMRIQYGGSVKPHNIAEFIAEEEIDGALVGGASLEAESFAGVIKKCQQEDQNR